MRAPEGGPQTHAPLLQPDLVRVGQDNLPLLGPQDDALLAPHLQQEILNIQANLAGYLDITHKKH